MKRRKRTSLRKLKRRFLLGGPISMEQVLDTARLDAFVKKHGYRTNRNGSFVVKA